MTNLIPSGGSSIDTVDTDRYIEDFAEMLRDILRAVAADDNTGALSSASKYLRNLVAQAEHLPPELNWYKILDTSVRMLKPPHVPFGAPIAHKHEYDQLAKCGVKLAAEITTSDSFSSARVSKARQAIANEMKSIAELRELRRDLRDSGLTT